MHYFHIKMAVTRKRLYLDSNKSQSASQSEPLETITCIMIDRSCWKKNTQEVSDETVALLVVLFNSLTDKWIHLWYIIWQNLFSKSLGPGTQTKYQVHNQSANLSYFNKNQSTRFTEINWRHTHFLSPLRSGDQTKYQVHNYTTH